MQNLPSLGPNSDPEQLHEIRIAIRRTRVALQSTHAVFPARNLSFLLDELAWLARITGPPRDLDLMLALIEQRMQDKDLAQWTAGKLFLEAARRQRERHYKKLTDALASTRLQHLLSAWRTFLNAPLPRRPSGSKARHAITVFANKQLDKNYRQLLKQAQRIKPDTPTEGLHALRKTTRKLRYQTELFAPLLPAQLAGKGISALKRLQDQLGGLQDVAVQLQFLQDTAGAALATNAISKAELDAWIKTFAKPLRERRQKNRKGVDRSLRHIDTW